MTKSHDDITDILRDRDRILMAAWMLPNEGVLSDAQRRQAMANFRSYCKVNGVFHKDVARQLGSPRVTTIGDLVKGIYRANADNHIRKLNMWVEKHARSTCVQFKKPFVTTHVANIMLATSRMVTEHRTMGMVLGPTGIGKSRCAQAIYETNVGSIYLRIMQGYHHSYGLCRAIAAQLDVKDVRTPQHKGFNQLERIVNILRNSNRLILLDEAHKLKDSSLELLRDIHDCAGVPIMLIATKDLHDRILKMIGPDYGQLYSRFDVVQHITQGYDIYSGGKPLFTIQDIKQLYHQIPIRISSDAAHYLQDVANELGHGSLRRCEILLKGAAQRARKQQNVQELGTVTITSEHLEWSETHLRKEATECESMTTRREQAARFSGASA